MINTVVYLDLVILSTIFVNYLFITSIGYLIKERVKVIRLILGISISLLSLVLFIVPIKYIYNLRYFVGILIGVVSYKKGKNKLIGISLMYLVNLGFIGTLVVFKISSIWLLLIVALLIVLLHFFIYTTNKVLKETDLTYNVILDGITYIGLYDTGNSSTYEGIPIVYLNKTLKSEKFQIEGVLKIGVVTGFSYVTVFRGPKVYIKTKEYSCYFVFSESINYDLILNSLMEV